MSGERARAVFLDRDGTIVEDVGYLRRVEDIRLLPGAAEALNRLKAAGFLLVIVTNQSAVARGWLTERELLTIEGELEARLRRLGAAIDAFYYCPHLPEGEAAPYARRCSCRKPAPGMLTRAAGEMGIALSASWMVGDSERDVEAGRRAGCRTVLLGRAGREVATFAAKNLAQAAQLILEADEPAAPRQ